MATRNYQSIGEVLVSLKPEFPDITISKIRFLEAKGLIEPERTPSGYRKFYEADVERLRSILKMQRGVPPVEGHQGAPREAGGRARGVGCRPRRRGGRRRRGPRR